MSLSLSLCLTGMVSRTNATHLVLSSGTSGNGQYLVRQSESREGDFVLTFNCHNRAKVSTAARGLNKSLVSWLSTMK